MGWRPPALSFIVLLAAGCAVSVVDLRDALDLNQSSFHDKLAANQGLADEFLTCTTRAYDERAVGKAVRGGSIFSTQNETFASALKTAAGVIAKKLVEHGGFCYFQTIHQSERRKEGS
jgi:hypothetical protein